jgi:hypothetical protein
MAQPWSIRSGAVETPCPTRRGRTKRERKSQLNAAAVTLNRVLFRVTSFRTSIVFTIQRSPHFLRSRTDTDFSTTPRSPSCSTCTSALYCVSKNTRTPGQRGLPLGPLGRGIEEERMRGATANLANTFELEFRPIQKRHLQIERASNPYRRDGQKGTAAQRLQRRNTALPPSPDFGTGSAYDKQAGETLSLIVLREGPARVVDGQRNRSSRPKVDP